MSEEETVTTTENVDEAAEVATPEVTEEVATTEEVESDAESETEEQEKPKPDPKIAKAKFEARELKRENKRLAKMLEMQLESAAKAQPEAKAPKIEDFETMESYLDARDKYRDSVREAKQEPKQDAKTPTQDSEYQYAYEDMTAYGSEKYDDFEEVINASNSVTPGMAAAILDVDDPDIQADVAYFIGQNPKEAARIARLPERRQIAEIGKLEAKLSEKPKPQKKASKAPAPIKPVGGAKTPSSEIKETMSYDDFMKVRLKQLGR